MSKRKSDKKHKEEIENALVNVIEEGSEGVTTLSRDVEAKYESIDSKKSGKDK